MAATTFTVEEFKRDAPDLIGLMRLHIGAFGEINETTPDELQAILASKLAMEMYVEKINAYTARQVAQAPGRR